MKNLLKFLGQKKNIYNRNNIIITHSERALFDLNARVEAQGGILRGTTQGHLNRIEHDHYVLLLLISRQRHEYICRMQTQSILYKQHYKNIRQ